MHRHRSHRRNNNSPKAVQVASVQKMGSVRGDYRQGSAVSSISRPTHRRIRSLLLLLVGAVAMFLVGSLPSRCGVEGKMLLGNEGRKRTHRGAPRSIDRSIFQASGIASFRARVCSVWISHVYHRLCSSHQDSSSLRRHLFCHEEHTLPRRPELRLPYPCLPQTPTNWYVNPSHVGWQLCHY